MRTPEYRQSVPQRQSAEVRRKIRDASIRAGRREVADRVAMGLPLLVDRAGVVAGPGMYSIEVRSASADWMIHATEQQEHACATRPD